MNYNQFSNLSCYEEFEIQCALTGISKIGILKEIGHKIDNHYFFISKDGIFNWYDLKGNHVENPGILKELKGEHIPRNIIKCIIPDGVINIGDYAFYMCESLTSISIPNSVTSIGTWAFYNCKSLKEITISNNIISIDDYAFWNCESLKEITMSDSITSIGKMAFYKCKSLTSIFIPDSVTSIGYEVFHGCPSLKEVIFKGKTLDEVKQIDNYSVWTNDESIIKCEI